MFQLKANTTSLCFENQLAASSSSKQHHYNDFSYISSSFLKCKSKGAALVEALLLPSPAAGLRSSKFWSY